MLRKLIVRNLDLYYVCCYIVICGVLYVSDIILFVVERLLIKFCIFEYSREAVILYLCERYSPPLLRTLVKRRHELLTPETNQAIYKSVLQFIKDTGRVS